MHDRRHAIEPRDRSRADFAEYRRSAPRGTRLFRFWVNLLHNASVACAGSGQEDRRINLRIAAIDGAISLSVTDNGLGIAKENLTRIFAYGFTTPGNGHGFGLHTGVLAPGNSEAACL